MMGYRAFLQQILDTTRAADHVITVSKSNMEILTKKLGVPFERISLIPNGFDEKLFRPMHKGNVRAELNLPPEKKIILTVGNLVPVKGHEYLIKAARKVVKERKDVFLLLLVLVH